MPTTSSKSLKGERSMSSDTDATALGMGFIGRFPAVLVMVSLPWRNSNALDGGDYGSV
jgi:hypothetical protein